MKLLKVLFLMVTGSLCADDSVFRDLLEITKSLDVEKFEQMIKESSPLPYFVKKALKRNLELKESHNENVLQLLSSELDNNFQMKMMLATGYLSFLIGGAHMFMKNNILKKRTLMVFVESFALFWLTWCGLKGTFEDYEKAKKDYNQKKIECAQDKEKIEAMLKIVEQTSILKKMAHA